MRRRSDISLHINRAALLENVRQIRGLCGEGVRFCAVTKANAYGHGLAEVTDILAGSDDVDYFAVFSPDEAFDYAGRVRQRFLSLEPVHPDMPGVMLHEAAELGVECTVASVFSAEYAAKMLRGCREPLMVQVNVDTGMGRCGVEVCDLPELLDFISGSDALQLVGIYTHFPTSDEPDASFAHSQTAAFKNIIAQYRSKMASDVIVHAANSAAAVRLPETHLDMVRCGIGIYGHLDIAEKLPVRLMPVMRVTAAIVHTITIQPGQTVSYGRTFTATRPTRVGLVPVGYGNGYDRGFSSKTVMMVRSKPAAVLGRVTMNLTAIDITDIPKATLGAYATIIDSNPHSPCSVAALAAERKTIAHEILTDAPVDATIIIE